MITGQMFQQARDKHKTIKRTLRLNEFATIFALIYYLSQAEVCFSSRPREQTGSAIGGYFRARSAFLSAQKTHAAIRETKCSGNAEWLQFQKCDNKTTHGADTVSCREAERLNIFPALTSSDICSR